MTATFKMPEPKAQWKDSKYGGILIAPLHSQASDDWNLLYTAEALRDVLEQAARVCEAQEDYGPRYDTPYDCAEAIRAMKEQIQ